MKTFITIILTAALTATATRFYKTGMPHESHSSATSAERKPHHYQCAMHPQVKSDKPGRCTICGMELTPIYEGGGGFDTVGGESIVPLTQSQIQVLQVQTVAAKTQPLTKTLKVAGTIDDNPHSHRIISAYVDGRIDQLYSNHLGAEVVEGEPLAIIYSPNLLQAEREYRQLSGDLKKNTGLRLQQMGLTSPQISEIANKSPDSLASQILAPVTGTVVDHEIYEGQYVTVGQKLFEIADFSTMWFQFTAYEQDMPWIEVGQTVSIVTPSKPGRTFVGKVAFIDPNFNEATRSTKIRVELENPLVNGKRELLHRLYADGAVEVKTSALLTVPRSAVIQTGAEAVVYVDRGGGSYDQKIVKIGRRGDQLAEILSGVSEGEKVVTNGNLLIDGQAELNRSFMPPAGNAEPDLDESKQKVIREFIVIADGMSAALAADDLAAFNKTSEPALMKTTELIDLLGQRAGLQGLKDAGHLHGVADLKTARERFYKFSMAAAAVLHPMRVVEGMPKFQIWECPMVNEAVPGAANKGRWIQSGARPIGNPYFGKAMQDCGEEIK